MSKTLYKNPSYISQTDLWYLPVKQKKRDRPQTQIAPSTLSADFGFLVQDCKSVMDQGADWLHIDVMDGHFVPNITLGLPVVQSLRHHIPKGKAFFDCHIMVSDPAKWFQAFKNIGADQYCFHLEAIVGNDLQVDSEPSQKVFDLVKEIRGNKVKAGLAIKPKTPVECAFPYVDAGIDMILVMTVEPGFGGQKFMPEMMEKVKALRSKYSLLNIQVDGGLSPKTVDLAAEAGANVIVAGSAIFGALDKKDVIEQLRQSVDIRATCACMR